MSGSHAERCHELFLQACQIEGDQREAFLDDACAGDAELRAGVEALLGLGQWARDSLLTRSLTAAPEVYPTTEEATPAIHPERVGSYKILDVLGQGGMGVVYRAEQSEPIRREVALKLIKAGMDTEQVIARFESERQALALMDHPSIARVYEAGATERGRPYFAMEFVRGIPITAYCDRERLSTKERLELFMRVCEGVQHAHQKGIIHRDIKPSNILVTAPANEAVPKIIDFGVAKATGLRLTERTLFTEVGQLIGTPEYLSPEQAEPLSQDVDTRSDVYSLGVLLYELLVGALPFDSRELRQAAFEEIRRKIREDDPPTPSARLDTLGEASTNSAARRRTDPPSLRKQLQGDLDWITMKALEKDRARRYGSPAEFAADIERHLRHEPVVASPPSTAYRARKFVRRHRTGVATAAVIALTLLGGIIGTTIGIVRANQARRGEERHRRIAEAVNRFLQEDLLGGANPLRTPDPEIKLREVLDRAAQRIAGSFPDNPEVEAAIQHTIGSTYGGMGRPNEEQRHLSLSLKIYRRTLGVDHPDTLKTQAALAVALMDQEQYDEAETMLRQALEGLQRSLGNDDRLTLNTEYNLGHLHYERGNLSEAESIIQHVMEAAEQTLGEGHEKTIAWSSGLVGVYVRQGRLAEAGELSARIEANARRELGNEHISTLRSMGFRAWVLRMHGPYDEGEDLGRELLQTQRRVLGSDHPDTLRSMIGLGWSLMQNGKLDEAEDVTREAVAGFGQHFGEENNWTLEAMNTLAVIHQDRFEFDQALELQREIYEIRRRRLGEEHPSTLDTMSNVGVGLFKLENYERAAAIYEEALEIRKRVFGEQHPATLTLLFNLGHVRWRQGKPAHAAELFLNALEGRRRTLGDDNVSVANILKDLGLLRGSQARWEEGAAHFQEARAIEQRVLGQDHPETLDTTRHLSQYLSELGKTDEAVSLMRESIRTAEQAENLPATTKADLRWSLGMRLTTARQYDEAEVSLLEAYRFYVENPRLDAGSGKPEPLADKIAESLVELYDAWNKPELAAKYRPAEP